jgi:serine/threonine protein kinase
MGGSTLPLAPGAYSGRKLGKYEVLCRLSTGGMAEIFLASQRGLAGFRKLVVLKQILPDIKGEEEFVRMFLDEAKVTAAFNHPNIAQVFDLDIADGELFLAMEFVPGATLVEVAKACRTANEPIPIGLSLAAARDTALALHYAHTFTDPLGRPSSVIHRDVAEKNIMVTYEGVTKLLDFGIAKSLSRRGRTQIGMVKGTSGYMSPEQILGEPLDSRSDLFSLGVVLHECLTGLRLFHAKTPEQGAGAVLHGQVPPPSRSNREVPPELDAIVLKALSRKRDDRYASTLEFARALERAVGPLIWHPEQIGEVIRRHFADRREQTRQLLMADQVMSGEATGEVRLSQIFPVAALQDPPAPSEPGTLPGLPSLPGLPQITATLPSKHGASSDMTVPAAKMPSGPPPPPPPEPQAKPPTPPRGAPTRRPTLTGAPSANAAEAASVRRAVFEPIPQKRSSAAMPPPPPSPEVALPPPPPPEAMTRAKPGEDPSRNRPPPAWTDENATRAAPPEEPPRPEPRKRTVSQGEIVTGPQDVPRPEPRKRTMSQGEIVTGPQDVPRSEPRKRTMTSQAGIPTSAPEAPPPGLRSRAPRMDIHTMGTIPMTETPASLKRHSAPGEDESTGRNDNPREVQTELRPRTNSSERVPQTGSNPNNRSQRRRAATPPPEEEEYTQDEHATHPVRALKAEQEQEEEPASDTNETLIPEGDGGIVTTPGMSALGERRRGWALPVMALLLLVLGGGAVVIALGLDGGRIVALIDPPPATVDPNRFDPLPRPDSPAKAVPADAKAAPSDPQKAAQPDTPPAPPAPLEATPTPATPDPTTTVQAATPEVAPPPSVTPPDTGNEPPENAAPDTPAELLTAPVDEEPAPAPKKVRTPPRRVRNPQKAIAEPGSETDAEPSEGTPPPAAAPATGTGLLTLVTDPYAKVYLGRKVLGDTPLFKVSLPAGKHSLRLVDGTGQSMRLSVEIKPDETTAVRIGLDALPKD